MFVNFDDLARLQYGRLLWRNPASRRALLRHWTDRRHPYRERYRRFRGRVDSVLAARLSDRDLDRRLRREGTSLRAVIREIPPVFGSFWNDRRRT